MINTPEKDGEDCRDASSFDYKRWPPRVCLRVYGTGMVVLAESRDQNYDLSDNIWRLWGSRRTLPLGVVTESGKWPVWDEDALKRIGTKLKADLILGRHRVDVSRDIRQTGGPCTGEFVWKLQMRFF
jgi:hypothetical protein